MTTTYTAFASDNHNTGITVEIGDQPLPMRMRIEHASACVRVRPVRPRLPTLPGVPPIIPVVGVTGMAMMLLRDRRRSR